MWHLRHNIESGWEPREKPGQTCWGHGLEMELILVAEEAASSIRGPVGEELLNELAWGN